ncbi:tRNA (guanine(46)-N(7))-methyltransferase TrmB [Nitrincola tapanii]|uniref:tRNA (guanine(46)-N(7))-methyltransferase n=1 Tax=Nitrincola tapanii TaxID=1708751 RepID=A0A5A9W857_9GAMM|nr:SAM-dependent methyltransferase [Nitrincola tapanii]KAA0876189.1 SAM-dependent methyltransferase [Nitrincola tapanii]
MTGNSRPVISKQTGPHPDLLARVKRYQQLSFLKPIAAFNQHAFAQAEQLWQTQGGPLILDSGCGVGDSTRFLAEAFPDHFVLGLDRSEDRLARKRPPLPDNAQLIRTDLLDFWRLVAAAHWPVARHYLLYPNPYPKPAQLGYRFHAHPAFPALMAISGDYFEARSNWSIYLQELQLALDAYGRTSQLVPLAQATNPISAFEAKYRDSGQTLWQLVSECALGSTAAPTQPDALLSCE